MDAKRNKRLEAYGKTDPISLVDRCIV